MKHVQRSQLILVKDGADFNRDFDGGLLTFIDKVVIQEKLSQCMLIVQFGSKGFWIK